MTDAASTYGLLHIGGNEGRRAVVVLHGIRQTRDRLREFANRIGRWLDPSIELYLYGYNHTLGLETNGKRLAETFKGRLLGKRVDLVGYSMGGLVARMAASESVPSPVHTVVTIATPNRGALSNAELTILGQVGRSIFEKISPLAVRTEGVKDLTRVVPLMRARRKWMMDQLNGQRLTAEQRRYVSIPALFYHKDKAEFELGPSLELGVLQAGMKLVGLKLKIEKMERSHDGIVTERSNRIVIEETQDFSELDLVRDAVTGSPARCHAVTDTCGDHDHGTIYSDPLVARLVAALIMTEDWRRTRASVPQLDLHARLYPFDAQ